MATTGTTYRDDERTFVRVSYEATVRCAYDNGHVANGITGDVSRGGFSLRLGHYVRPGRFVLLSVEEIGSQVPLELKGEIAWCRPEGTEGAFRAGVRVIHDEPEAFEGLSRLVHVAVLPSAGWMVVPPAADVPQGQPAGWQPEAPRAYAATA